MRGSHLATVGRRRSGTSAMAMAAIFLFSIGATLAAPVARAADSVTVSGNGTVLPFPGSGQPSQSFDVNATDDGAGNVTGPPDGPDHPAVFQRQRPVHLRERQRHRDPGLGSGFGAGGGLDLGHACMSTRAGRAAIPSTSTGRVRPARPTCPTTPAPAGPFPVSTGGITVTIVPGATGPLSVTGNGTFQAYVGAPTPTSFTVSVSKNGAGVVTGFFTVTDGTSFSASCLYVQGANAIMTGTYFNGVSTVWATLYVHDGGASGDAAQIDGPIMGGTPSCPTNPPPGGLPPLTNGGVTISGVGGAPAGGSVDATGRSSNSRVPCPTCRSTSWRPMTGVARSPAPSSSAVPRPPTGR